MTETKSEVTDIIFRPPKSEDGLAVHQLIGRCPPLDTNSIYCNLLHCSHWSATSICAEIDGEIMGFISGYRVPEANDHLFIWQVAVDSRARGKGLAGRMLRSILQRSSLGDIRFLQTTINPDNRPSWALFEALAAQLNTGLQTHCLFGRESHFGGEHEDEIMLTIGPFEFAGSRSDAPDRSSKSGGSSDSAGTGIAGQVSKHSLVSLCSTIQSRPKTLLYTSVVFAKASAVCWSDLFVRGKKRLAYYSDTLKRIDENGYTA